MAIEIGGLNQVINNLKVLFPKTTRILKGAVDIASIKVMIQAQKNLEKTGGTGHGGKHIVTGLLQKSLSPPLPTKETLTGFEGGVAARMEYAIYEEVRHPFLFPALSEKANEIQADTVRILKRLGL